MGQSSQWRYFLVVLHDAAMAALVFELSVWLRLYSVGLPQPFFSLWQGTAVFTLVAVAVFWWQGLQRGIWRYTSFADIKDILRAATFAVLIFLPVMFLLTRLEGLPRSAMAITWVILIAGLALPRLLYRLMKDGDLNFLKERNDGTSCVPVLLIGAGDLADIFMREMERTPNGSYRVVGILDDKGSRIGRNLRGVRIFGAISALKDVVEQLSQQGRRPQRLIIATDRIDGASIATLMEHADQLGLPLSRIPHLTEFHDNQNNNLIAERPINVEDLLGRPQKVLNRGEIEDLVTGRRVIVTGAGGTIGAELTRQIADLGPSRLVLFDNSEFALYQIDFELAEKFGDIDRVAYLGDVRDKARIDQVFQLETPDLVFHAAAFKHVPMVEANPNEGVLTNVIGTQILADAAVKAECLAMVLISTDKAVYPTSVMGATKRVAEMICQGQSLRGGSTRFVTVRFGNVLGSTGSVVPLFQRQLAHGGPLTVTHPDITRYFMTTREAVELVLQATSATPEEGEEGKIFVLDMGEPVRIVDLARQMIRLAGRQPDEDIEITFSGLRPGEKLHEELFHDKEPLVSTHIVGVMLAAPRFIDFDLLKRQLQELEAGARDRNTELTLANLGHLVPEFRNDDEQLRRNSGSASD
jgi:O-antigen biosynthesis protein WbqV